MCLSFNKYGKVSDAYPSRFSAIETLRPHLEKYKRDPNTEYLVDAANYFMIEFMCPTREVAFHGNLCLVGDDIFQALETCCDTYVVSGDQSFLACGAALCMIEYKVPTRPGAYFKGRDSSESLGRAAYDTNFDLTQKSNLEASDNEWQELQKLKDEI